MAAFLFGRKTSGGPNSSENSIGGGESTGSIGVLGVRSKIFSFGIWLAGLTDSTEQAQQSAYDLMIRAVGENRHVDNLLIFHEPPEGQDASVSMREFTLKHGQ